MNLYGKLHFLKNRDPCPTKGTMTKQGPKNSKMSTYKTEYVFSLSLGILDCNTEMGNEITFYPANSWVLLNQLRIVTFGNILVVMNIGLMLPKVTIQ